MNKTVRYALWILAGATAGAVGVLVDRLFTGEVTWTWGGLIHAPVETIGGVALAAITLAWAFGWVTATTVKAALLAIVAWIIAAYLTGLLLPFLQALLFPPKP